MVTSRNEVVRRILLLGDSLTARGIEEDQGWGLQLTRRFIGSADVIHRGFGGYSSRMILQEMDVLVRGVENVDVALVWFGANDSVLHSSGFTQFCPIDEFCENLKRIVEKLKKKPVLARRVVVLTPPPLVEDMRLKYQEEKYGNKATGELERTSINSARYASALKEELAGLAEIVDIYVAFVEAGPRPLLCDGLHLSRDGQDFVFRLVSDQLSIQPKPLVPASDVKPCYEPGRSLRTVLKNGRFWDWQLRGFTSPGSCLEIENGKIVRFLKEEEIDDKEEIYDLKGGFVLPGLADAHIHVFHMGENMNCVALNSCRSIDDLKSKVKAFVEAHPERKWFVGVGYDHEQMGGHLPTRRDLDACGPPGTKVVLWRVCFHILSASTAAFEAAGIQIHDPPKVDGGAIDTDNDGNATGVLRERACERMNGQIKETNRVVQKRYIKEGLHECLKSGLTSVQTNDEGMLSIYQELDQKGELPIRVHLTLKHGEIRKKYKSTTGMLSCDRVKLFTDGALGANTAAIRPAENEPGHRGILIHEQDELNRIVSDANATGMRIEAHAIGDYAAECTLKAFKIAGLSARDRPVLTHCQVLGPDLVELIAANGVIANVQPSFVPTDAAWINARLEKSKLPWSYCWKTLLLAGAQVSGGSDSPVESCSPLQGIYDAMFRPSSHQRETAQPMNAKECLSLMSALHLYTLGAQFAARQERARGRIDPGFDADFTVIDKDIVQNPKDLLEVNVEMVFVGGKLRFVRSEGEQTTSDVIRNNGPFAKGKGGDPEALSLSCGCGHH